jgi:hypothetical protein
LGTHIARKGALAAASVAVVATVFACQGSNPCSNLTGCVTGETTTAQDTQECNELVSKCGSAVGAYIACYVQNEKCNNGQLDENATTTAVDANCASQEQAVANNIQCIESFELGDGGTTITNDDCGFPGQPCCTEGGAACSDGCCDPQTKQCVGVDETCSGGTGTCVQATGASTGSCTPCGATGQDCCPGDQCTSGCCDTNVNPGMCVGLGGTCSPIGTIMQVCPASGSATCQSCGDEFDPCCPGNVCNGQGVVCMTTAGTAQCMTCGDLGDPCCPGNVCSDGLSVCGTSGGSMQCLECGDLGDPCCPGNMCNDGVSVCLAGDGGMQCEECGNTGEPCCANSQCTGSTCTSGMCM